MSLTAPATNLVTVTYAQMELCPQTPLKFVLLFEYSQPYPQEPRLQRNFIIFTNAVLAIWAPW